MIEYNGVVIETHPDVYEPSKDTFLLVENLNLKRSDEVLEIGTGTGLIAVYTAQKCKKVVATDIDENAIKCTLKNTIANSTYNVELKQGNLFEPVTDEKFDLILFNSINIDFNKENNEIMNAESDLEIRTLLNKFIEESINYLNEKGRIQLLQSSICDIEKTTTQLKDLGFDVEINARENFSSSEIVLITGTLN